MPDADTLSNWAIRARHLLMAPSVDGAQVKAHEHHYKPWVDQDFLQKYSQRAVIA